MNTKTIVTAALLLFVVASLAVLVLKETKSNGANAADESSKSSAAAVSVADTPDSPAQVVDFDPEGPERQVTVYYFCNTVRCPSCHKIENWSHEAVTTSFEDELDEGLLRWSMVNTDQKEYAHYIDDYELFTKQVVLVERVKGEQTRWRNLDQVWDLLGSQEKFAAYIVDETEQFLAGDSEGNSALADGLDVGEGDL
jgi:hypothetical protein